MSIGASGESAQAQWASREVQEFTGFDLLPGQRT